MGPLDANTVMTQFKRCFDEETLNALGKTTRLCRRERDATPYRLMLALLQAFAGNKLESIADIHRTFNALNDQCIQYKPFHNQLAKPGFPAFTQAVLSRVLEELAIDVLQFSPASPFARFEQIRLQDGTSFALKGTLAEHFPGRFNTVSPAAVELHVDIDLLSEGANRIALAPDCVAERPFLPEPEALADQLLIADRGYFDNAYAQALECAGASFIMRGKADRNPLIVAAFDPQGRPIEGWIGQRLKQVPLNDYEWVDLSVRLKGPQGPFDCRLIVHANLDTEEKHPRFLYTNLAREHFSAEQISDAYRLRWQIELLFKEWKSYANLKGFDTANPHIAEGLIWASLCAAALARFCAHATECVAAVPMSTQRVAKCIHHVLADLLYDLMHRPRQLLDSLRRAIDYLAQNAQRAHPKRDRQRGRLKLGLHHISVAA